MTERNSYPTAEAVVAAIVQYIDWRARYAAGGSSETARQLDCARDQAIAAVAAAIHESPVPVVANKV